MLVNLTDVFLNEGKVLEQSIPYEKDEFCLAIGKFRIKEASKVSLKLSNLGPSKALIEGNASITVAMQCDRCLQDVDHTFDLTFCEEVFSPDKASEAGVDDEENNFMDGFNLDTDVLVENEILLNWPMKILCKEDCKGICKVCGKNLNDGDCGCDDFVPDPRWAAIKDIFNANKEV